MNVGLIDLGGKLPNLALMKLSAYHKSRGDSVSIGPGGKYDKVYMSCVFSWHKHRAQALNRVYPNAIIGGSGWDLYASLPIEIEQMKPDYALYDISYGMGYTSRGCIRKCDVCVVPRKEGTIRSIGTISDLVNPRTDFVILLDNNFLASPDCLDRIQEIEDLKLIVNFSQGLDIRLVNDENAARLARIRFTNLHRTRSTLYFAFDHVGIEGHVREGVATLIKHGIKPWQIAFYILCGYNSSFEEDVYRVNLLRGLGVAPFVMVYNKGDRRLRHFARWVNRILYRQCTWDDYIAWEKARLQTELPLPV